MLSALSEEQLNKRMSDLEHMWWSEPMTLIFGKATVPTKPWEAIFPDVEPPQKEPAASVEQHTDGTSAPDSEQPLILELGDPWHFYEKFRYAHKMKSLPVVRTPEIAVKNGTVVGVPLIITRKPGATRDITINVSAPNGWNVISGTGKFVLPDDEITYLRVELRSPAIPEKELKERQADSILVSGMSGAKSAGEVRLKVLLRSSALPQ